MTLEQHNQVRGIFKLLREAQSSGLWADCQEGALAICSFIDDNAKKGTKTVALLDKYCKLVYDVNCGRIESSELDKALSAAEKSYNIELCEQSKNEGQNPSPHYEPVAPCNLTAEDAPRLLTDAVNSAMSDPMASYLNMRQAFALDPDLPKKMGNLTRPDYTYDADAETVLERCPVCKTGDATPFYNAFSYQAVDFEMPFSPAKLWMTCNNCGNLYTYGFPKILLETKNTAAKLISPQKGVYATAAENMKNTFAIWDRILASLKSYTGGEKLLEVGIGNGELLAVAAELGYEITTVEVVESAAQKVSDILGLPIWCVDFLKYETEERYDIIIMGDVIEHVTDPPAALIKARSLLKPNGVLWLSTPNYESSWTRMMKFSDAMWNEPFHISWFSRETLLQLLQKHGFELREYAISARYYGSMEIIATVTDATRA